MKELNLPPMSESMEDIFKQYKEIMEKCHNENKTKKAIYNQHGFLVWEEPLEEYEQRMKELSDIETKL